MSIPRIHGLIIGINRYKQAAVHPPLHGCIGDAKSVLKYFTDLGVPERNFKFIYDQYASRADITSSIVNHLIRNPNIKRHDPIVIYFAGHGDRTLAPPGWQTTDGMVEMILPYDASTYDIREQYVHGIPDLTLAFLLYKLSQEKGNNITVILDSCHSGSGTRGEVRARNSHDANAPPVPEELDEKLRKSLDLDYPSEVEHNVAMKQASGSLLAPSLETHVLLAACRDEELAQEVPNEDPDTGEIGDPPSSGIFTTTLLKELYKCDITKTSYTTLIRNLLVAYRDIRAKSLFPLSPQTFQCEGRNQDRLLFSVHYSVSKGKIGLIQTSDKSVYRIRIGSAQRIVPGTEFGVFTSSMSPSAPPLAILVARDVGPTASLLHGVEPNSPPDIPGDAYVTILRYNDHSDGVRIWLHEDIKRYPAWKEPLLSLESLPVSWAASRENHDLEILPSPKGVELRGAHLIPGKLETSHIIETIGRDIKGKALTEALTAIVYFHFHLKIQNKEAPVRAQLGMALRELVEKDNSWGSIIYEAKPEDLFGDSLATGSVATLYPDTDKVFGLELTNNSGENLYPYVLYYDFEDYSVGCLYEPPGRSVKAPLQAGKSLVIGYGSSGSQPFQVDFTRPESDKEYGAFVLLVFSEWVDIAYLQQESPLQLLTFDARGERRAIHSSSVWDNVIVRVQMVKRK